MNLSEKNRKKKIVKQEKKRKKRKEKRVEELERKTEEKMIQKKKLRRKIKEKLSFTTEKYRKEADRKITESVLELNEYKSADCVFCYVSTEKEIDTFSILQDILQSGKHLGVPKCTGKGIMNVYEIHSLQELYPGAYGILEPKEDPERLIQPEAIVLLSFHVSAAIEAEDALVTEVDITTDIWKRRIA